MSRNATTRDITDLEASARRRPPRRRRKASKLTMLAFMIKACVTALRQYPQFNSSLDKSGESIIIKKYFHIGVAVDTPGGLVVPVSATADRKGSSTWRTSSAEISKARARPEAEARRPAGRHLSISSLGGIGGSYFTPIINAPRSPSSRIALRDEAAVDGSIRSAPHAAARVSYDHRVIDGATAARFTTYLVSVLSDIRS